MNYEGSLYRPPSEASSLLIQVTVGCSYNQCTYCSIYRNKQFRAKKWETIRSDIDEASTMNHHWRRAFLMDGDALILSTPRLLQILNYLREKIPGLERVGVYGDCRSILLKTVAELKQLKQAGLGIIYHGFESGHDQVLARVNKGSTKQETIKAGKRVKESGITYSAIVLLGIGSTDLSREHARQTADVLNQIDPDYVGALTLTLIPGSTIYQQAQQGEFVLPDKFQFLEELQIMVESTNLSACRFSANHASNYLPIRANFPQDKERVLAMLNEVISRRDDSVLKPEYMRGL